MNYYSCHSRRHVPSQPKDAGGGGGGDSGWLIRALALLDIYSGVAM